MERKNYIDNLRWICCIVLLIPYHAAMAYNTWGEDNYIILGSSKVLSSFVVALSPFFMGLLFLLAGMSAKLSLKKRSRKKFITERVLKLLIPLIFGTAVIVPFLSYMADMTAGYTGGYFEHYSVFFTKFTDLSGYDGGFTVGHLWFLLYLFVIAAVALILDMLFGKSIEKLKTENTHAIVAVILTLLAASVFHVKVGGKSILTYFLLYLLGFYVFSEEAVIDRLKKHTWIFLPIFALSTAANVWVFIWSDLNVPALDTILTVISGSFGILFAISFGARFLNGSNKATRLLSSVSFPSYIVHFCYVVGFEYILSLSSVANTAFVFSLSSVISVAATVATAVGIKYCPILRAAFGYKPLYKNPRRS